jgi:hypothetical protein
MRNLFNEIITENLSSLCNDIDTNVQEAFPTPNRHEQKRTTLSHIIIKMPKVENKERILNTAGEKCQFMYKGQTPQTSQHKS